MTSRKRMEHYERWHAVGCIEEGQSITGVALFFGVHHSVISRLWKQLQTTQTVVRRPVAGRPRVTTPAEDQYIAIAAKRNRTATSTRVTSMITASIGKAVSAATVRQRLHMNGLYALVPRVCVPLYVQSRGARLKSCLEHGNRTVSDWSNAMFTDESRFALEPDDMRINIWRKQGTRNSPKTSPNITHSEAAALWFLVLVIVAYTRNRRPNQKYGHGDVDDDVRENIISYDDEGGGEDDMNAYDITPLRIPIDSTGTPIGAKPGPEKPPIKEARQRQIPPGGHPDGVGDFIRDHLDKADNDPNAPPFDDLRNYAYEGCGSTAGSLSSLASGAEDNEQDFDYLNGWGPRFQKLADMYGPGDSEED
ncbi:neural-cadherin [Trichonephila clavipes]|nr:neural-cadherin [Trichonephila clavipes]